MASSGEDEVLHVSADIRWKRIQATGQTVPWDEAIRYLQERVRGIPARKPPPRTFKA